MRRRTFPRLLIILARVLFALILLLFIRSCLSEAGIEVFALRVKYCKSRVWLIRTMEDTAAKPVSNFCVDVLLGLVANPVREDRQGDAVADLNTAL